jgi:hypothetical protein
LRLGRSGRGRPPERARRHFREAPAYDCREMGRTPEDSPYTGVGEAPYATARPSAAPVRPIRRTGHGSGNETTRGAPAAVRGVVSTVLAMRCRLREPRLAEPGRKNPPGSDGLGVVVPDPGGRSAGDPELSRYRPKARKPGRVRGDSQPVRAAGPLSEDQRTDCSERAAREDGRIPRRGERPASRSSDALLRCHRSRSGRRGRRE